MRLRKKPPPSRAGMAEWAAWISKTSFSHRDNSRGPGISGAFCVARASAMDMEHRAQMINEAERLGLRWILLRDRSSSFTLISTEGRH